MAEQRQPAYLILEDGSRFEGVRMGAAETTVGEVVFNTSMTGYQEMLTDPSYGGQILVPTYPMIGNYGINSRDWESGRIQVRGFVVRQDCDLPSNPDSVMAVEDYLITHGVPGIAGVDTRAITRRLRNSGVMMGVVTDDPDIDVAVAAIRAAPRYGEEDVVTAVSTPTSFSWTGEERHGAPEQSTDSASSNEHPDGNLNIVVDDFGVKYNILRELESRDCNVTVIPAGSPAEDVLAHNPDGALLSPGPGDPELLDRSVETVKALAEKRLPMMGICLGHQVIARAFGASTFKLKFGHRGGNHSVRDNATGRVYVTAQNHGYSVSAEDLPPELEVSHIDLSDGTVEGLRHKTLPIMTIQYHSEASPGPLDNEYLFDRFVDMVRANTGVTA